MTGKSNRLDDELRALSLTFAREGYFTEFDVCAEQDGEVLAHCAATSDCSTGSPASADRQFDIASLTKLFTTTAILKLASEKRIELDTVIARQAWATPLVEAAASVQDFPEILELLNKLTITSLLTHTSSLPAWYPFYAGRGVQDRKDQELDTANTLRADTLAASTSAASMPIFEKPLNKNSIIPDDFFPILGLALRAETRVPLGQMLYSDINFMLLGMIVAIVMQGQQKENLRVSVFEGAMQRLVLEPLALGDTTFSPQLDRAVPTEFGNRIEMEMVKSRGLTFSGWRPIDVPLRGQVDDGNSFYYFGGRAGHAGLFSTAKNLCSLCNLYLFEGQHPTSSALPCHCIDVFDPAMVRRAVTNTGLNRGLGFEFGPRYPNGFGHTGFTGTMVYINPERRLSVAILTNRLNVPEPRSVDPYRSAIVQAILASQNPTFSLGS